MNRVAVNLDVDPSLCTCVAETLNQSKDGRGLGIVQACVVAHHHIVVLDVDVGNLVRVERRDEVGSSIHTLARCRLCRRRHLQSMQLVALATQMLKDVAHLHHFGVFEGR